MTDSDAGAEAVVIGVDSSTQSTKVETRRLDTGEVVGRGQAPHPATFPPVSEQEPRDWWRALVAAIGELGALRHDVVAIAVAGQQHGLVLTDDTGDPLRPAKLWNDTTSASHAARMVREIGAERWAELVGTIPVPSITITKLAWVAEHQPDVLARTRRVMLPHDYLTWRLTGEHVTDRGDASGTGWYDPVTDAHRDELLAAAIGDTSFQAAMPRVLGPTEPAGPLTAEAARTLGLPAGIIVGPGTGDNAGAALGLGLRPGDVAISLGTSGVAFAVSATPTRDPSGAVAGFASASGEFLPLVCTLNATKVTDTVARWLGVDPAGLAELALATVDDPGDVAVVPYFDGERTPNRPDATGSFHGLTTTTTRAQLALAAHDGVLCGLLDGVDALAAAGASVGGRLFLVGGGARSGAYRQRLADLSGREVIVADTDETVATGAAVQAAVVATGDTFADVATRWRLGTGTTVAPAVDARHRRDTYRAARRVAG
ncbi:MAG: xylulokinase [Desertimonas sp.]